jgi:tRNA (cytidine/uridine-2'-O-)-methyltransferase
VFHVVLVTPEIPPNTGNAIRLCANTGCSLHLVEPLGFTLSDASCAAPGLTTPKWPASRCIRTGPPAARRWANPPVCADHQGELAVTPAPTICPATRLCSAPNLGGCRGGCWPTSSESHRLRLPLIPGNRSLNLSNAVAVMVYEAWRQQDFAGGG